MKCKVTSRLAFVLLLFIAFQSFNSHAQVGINTTTPADGSMLDIESTDKGLLIPRVNIADLSTIAPITGGSPESLIVYNTNIATEKGFYFWDGTKWVKIASGKYWELEGNAGTVSGTGATQNFLGTTDAQNLVLATNSTEALRITTAQRLLAGHSGTVTDPEFSFTTDTDTGIFRSGVDQLNISSGGREMVEFTENGINSEVVFNDTGAPSDFRVETDSEPNMLFIDGTSNEIGIKTNDPRADLHIGGPSTGIRIDAFSAANNANNNGVDEAVVFIDANGDLLIKPSLEVNQMPVDNSSTFVPTQVNIDSPSGNLVSQIVYSTTITLTQDALVEVVYQLGANILYTDGSPITDGRPRQYGTATYIGPNLVGYTSESYTSYDDNSPGPPPTFLSGTFFLNGNGYAQLTGTPAGTSYTIDVVGFVATGSGDNVRGEFGGTGSDRIQVILHY